MHEKQLLIVDDAAWIVSRIRTMLEGLPGLGHVLSAGTYATAVTILAQTQPDLVLLDINLPDLNGIDLLRYIKEYHPSIIVIMCSNQSSPFYRNVCKRFGAAYFIDKSSEFENIPAIVANYLR